MKNHENMSQFLFQMALSSSHHITHFLAILNVKRKGFHSLQTVDDNSKVTSQILQTDLILYPFKLALYFDSLVINNQIDMSS